MFHPLDCKSTQTEASKGWRYTHGMKEKPTYREAAAALAELGLAGNASAYHGLLCGALCVQEPEEIDLLHLVEGEEPTAEVPQALAILIRLRDAAAVALSDMQTGFMPLLPEDGSQLGERAEALSLWCEGFIFGLAALQHLDFRQCSEEMRELIQDFTEFTKASLHEADDPEAEEAAYAELVEYIRVGTQLIFMELRSRRQNDPSNSRTLH